MSKPAEYVKPNPTLKDKMGGDVPAFDAEIVAKAEAALRSLSGKFEEWMNDEVDKLDVARRLAKSNAYSEESLDALFHRAHDVKGLGSTYDYPLVTALAASLCRMLETSTARAAAAAAPTLIEAHVDAVRAVVRDGVRDIAHPTGKALLKALEGHVDALTSAA